MSFQGVHWLSSIDINLWWYYSYASVLVWTHLTLFHLQHQVYPAQFLYSIICVNFSVTLSRFHSQFRVQIDANNRDVVVAFNTSMGIATVDICSYGYI